ncbi:hypothetical protein DPSP01_013453 [Paraphaeosphaeria sporulosa]
MPSIVQATLINSGFFKDKIGEQLASAFTAVNGRNSPPSPAPRLNLFNGMTTTTQPRPVSRHSPEESKPRMSARDNWSPPRPAAGALQQNGVQNGNSNGLLNGNNCQRGGFICEGYANKVPWPKNGTPRPTAPLVAKDRFLPDPTQRLYHSHGASREGYTDSTSPNGPDGDQARPIVMEEQDHTCARSDWTNGWVDAPLPAYSQEQQHRPEYTPASPQSSYRRSPLSTSAPPARQHTARNYHHTQESMAKHLNHKDTPAANDMHPSQQAMIVSHAASAGPAPAPSHYAPPSPRHERSEKIKMLNEEPFHPFDRELVAEREKCKNAIYRFNNTNNTHLTISPDEVERNFRAILLASWAQTFGGTAPTGHLGNPVVVETPFYCDYGYNIHIGSNVAIGMDCKFLDSGDITIGDNTTICANVTIDTVKTPADPRFTRGCGLQRTSTAAKVHIGRNVWIGTNCLLLAGVSIGDNATVHPGSVVVRDIPAERHARGPPADYF